MSIKGVKANDSTFIKTALEVSYKNELGKLANRSVKGTLGFKRNNPRAGIVEYQKKEAITPAKLAAIQGWYNDRITKYAVDSTDFIARANKSKFHKLLATSIANIVKRAKTENQADIGLN